ncbi:MAG: VOC family protein [Patescibacteria group bacterium]
MTKYRFDHIHFRSKDIEFTKKFWLEILGARLIKERELLGAPSYTFDLNGTSILVSGRGAGEKFEDSVSENLYGFWHFALLVNDISLSLQELKKQKIECFHDSWEIRKGVKVAFVRGPDNISIELIERQNV